MEATATEFQQDDSGEVSEPPASGLAGGKRKRVMADPGQLIVTAKKFWSGLVDLGRDGASRGANFATVEAALQADRETGAQPVKILDTVIKAVESYHSEKQGAAGFQLPLSSSWARGGTVVDREAAAHRTKGENPHSAKGAKVSQKFRTQRWLWKGHTACFRNG